MPNRRVSQEEALLRVVIQPYLRQRRVLDQPPGGGFLTVGRVRVVAPCDTGADQPSGSGTPCIVRSSGTIERVKQIGE